MGKTSHYILILIIFSACGLKIPENTGDTVVGEVNQRPVTLSELKANFDPVVRTERTTTEDLVDFLPSYITFKTKLRAARDSGYMQRDDLNRELNTYATQAAYPYWLKNIVDKELYNEYEKRSREMLRAKQLLIRLPPSATPSDTQRIYNRLMKARREYLAGTSFDVLVERYASVVNQQRQGGDIGYFSAGQTVKSFEDAAYSLSVDSISKPIRTQFGYHLILVTERKTKPRDRNLSHIFFETRGQDANVDTALAKAYRAYRELKNGMPWNEAVQKYSEDPVSRNKNGDIGWFNYGRLQESFIDSIYAIDKVGVPTKPKLTVYGVHIFRLDSIRTYASEKQRQEALKEELEQLPRYKNRREIVHSEVLQFLNAQLINMAENRLIDTIKRQPDTLKLKKFSLPEKLQNLVHYIVGDSSYTVNDYVTWLQSTYPNQYLYTYKQSWLQSYETHLAQKHMVNATLNRFPEFVVDYNEFRNSLAVFQITQDSVWNYAENDTALLQSYYNEHRNRYKQPEQYLFYTITANTDSLLQSIQAQILSGTPPDSIRQKATNYRIKLDSVHVDLISDDFYGELKNMEPGQFSDVFDEQNKKKMYYLINIEKVRQKSFAEAMPNVLHDIQQQREQQWIDALYNRYNVKLYPKRLRKALHFEKTVIQ